MRSRIYFVENISQKAVLVEGDVPVILGGQEPAYYIDKSNHGVRLLLWQEVVRLLALCLTGMNQYL